jgi:cytochrome c553
MKAIPMQAMCAACHGTKVNKRLDEKIKTYYPDDRATGFQEGDIRGAFSVLIKKSP